MWKFFLIRQNRATNQRSGIILEVQIRSFGARAGARASKFSFSTNSRGLKYQYCLVKIGTKLPLTIKNKRRNTNLKFEFQNYFIFTPEKARFWFLKKHPKKIFSSCFGSDSALKTINTQLLFCSVFLKMHQKKLLTAKNAILAIFEN